MEVKLKKNKTIKIMKLNILHTNISIFANSKIKYASI